MARHRLWLPPAWPHLALQAGLRWLCTCPCMQCDAPEGDPLCFACMATLGSLPRRHCPRCLGSLSKEGACPLCARGPVPFEAVLALGPYTGGLRQAIRAMKYRGRADLGLSLGEPLAAELKAWQGTDWLVVPIPIHARRRAERGYNQVEPLAWQVARRLGWSYDARALERLGRSAPFYQQGRRDRWSEAQAAFQAQPPRLQGRSVLLVDDILTSGATLWSAAQAVRSAGARRVRAAVLARATMRPESSSS
ncbi:MAG TPA: ComF family protein [Stenomitos sp.]